MRPDFRSSGGFEPWGSKAALRLERINLRKIPRFIPLTHEAGRGPGVKEKVSRLRDGYDLGGAALLVLALLALFESWAANFPAAKKGDY